MPKHLAKGIVAGILAGIVLGITTIILGYLMLLVGGLIIAFFLDKVRIVLWMTSIFM